MTTLTVEGRKFANLNGSHGHWRTHQALMDAWKQLAVIEIRRTRMQPVEPPVHITAVIHRTTNAKADAHNCVPTIKACVDALVSEGVIPDDNDRIVHALTITGGPKAPFPTIDLKVEAAS